MKRLISVLLFSCMIIFLTQTVFAWDFSADLKVGRHNLKITRILDFDDGDLELSGTLAEVEVTAENVFKSNLYLFMRLNLSKVYSFDQDSSKDFIDVTDADAHFFRGEGRVGYFFDRGKCKIIPYAGLGGDYYKLDLDYEYEFFGLNQATIDEKNKTFYWKVGVKFDYNLTEDITMFADISTHRPFYAKMKLDYEEGSFSESYDEDFDKKFSYEAELGASYKRFYASVFYELRKYGKVESDGVLLSEKTEVKNIGVKVGIKF